MALVRHQWPAAAAVAASSLQVWADKLLAAVEGGRVQLPVVEGEIGDTWVSETREGRRAGLLCCGHSQVHDKAALDRLIIISAVFNCLCKSMA